MITRLPDDLIELEAIASSPAIAASGGRGHA